MTLLRLLPTILSSRKKELLPWEKGNSELISAVPNISMQYSTIERPVGSAGTETIVATPGVSLEWNTIEKPANDSHAETVAATPSVSIVFAQA